jgi:hypothetical protein
MSSPARLQLGAPGLYWLPDPPLRALTGVRLDVCAFAGVAPRGPAREPVRDASVGDRFWRGDVPCVEPERPRRRTVGVAVESFDEYLQIFGGFEGPGRLPYAVAAFFENGGRRAIVARIVHDYGPGDRRNDGGVASAMLAGVTLAARLRARSEGAWGNGITAELHFAARPLVLDVRGGSLRLGRGAALPAATLLRVTLEGGTRVLRFVSAVVDMNDVKKPRTWRQLVLDAPLPGPAARFEVVEATLVLRAGPRRVERLESLGLAYGHPRWLAQVLCDESRLAWPDAAWAYGSLVPADVDLAPTPAAAFADGADRWADLVPADFFDPDWSPEAGEPGSGICCFAEPLEAASLVVPDLYSHAPLAPFSPVAPEPSLAGPSFARCVMPPPAREQQRPSDDLPGLRLDPLLDLDAIAALQSRVIEFVEATGEMVALLDVPPGIDPARIRRWRERLASSYAAAYHPWLDVARRDDLRDVLVSVPPSAVAAGIVAARELALGVPHGPANVIAAEVVRVAREVSPALHDELHQAGINMYLRERDGVRLTGARTLATDPIWRQLSVRRLVILLRRVLLAQMQWAVFEPNGRALWRELRGLLEAYLRELYRAGAFRGAIEDEAFFVRCDASTNPRYERDAGRVVAEVGVAPSEPLEFIVLRIARDGDGTLTVRE